MNTDGSANDSKNYEKPNETFRDIDENKINSSKTGEDNDSNINNISMNDEQPNEILQNIDEKKIKLCESNANESIISDNNATNNEKSNEMLTKNDVKKTKVCETNENYEKPNETFRDIDENKINSSKTGEDNDSNINNISMNDEQPNEILQNIDEKKKNLFKRSSNESVNSDNNSTNNVKSNEILTKNDEKKTNESYEKSDGSSKNNNNSMNYENQNELLKNNDEKKQNFCEKNDNEKRETMNCTLNEESHFINILLLGETGVGKSTWINGFVNYLTYDSLHEAEKRESVSLIPSNFTVTDSDFKEHTITYGSDNDTNEETKMTGQSATQMPKTYVFNMQNVKIRIIDTPGIGDTRGIEKDKENMQNIMSHLSHYEDINGIIILLKPNNARLNVMFEFCIKELLTHLHKDACKNIVICFTNARSTFYRPGDTMPALKALLSKKQSIDIKLTRDTVYCLDNEPVRFLMALKSIEFEESERQEYATSWKKAVDESMRLICHISSLHPHLIQKTLSINEVRRSIIEQSRPMALIAKAIQTNIDAIKDKQTEEISANSSKQELHKQLKVPTVHLKIINLNYPKTVCTSPSCVDLIASGSDGKHQTHYKTICHNRCSITTNKNVIRCVELQQCAAMNGYGKCKKCFCSWETHMHITYDVKQETVMIEDQGIKKLINGKDGAIKAIQEHQKHLADKLKQLKIEKQQLAEVNARFACFLKHNAIAPYNDALLNYLNHLIENEQMKVGVGVSPNTLNGLISMKNVYQAEIEAIEEAMKGNNDPNQNLDVKKMNELILELKRLPNIGEMLKDVMTGVTEANKAATKLSEQVISVPSKRTATQLLRKITNQVLYWTGLK